MRRWFPPPCRTCRAPAPPHDAERRRRRSCDPNRSCMHRGRGAAGRPSPYRQEERTMRLLLCLAERAGEVVSIEDLLDRVWPEVIVTPDSVYQAVATLRRLLGDDPRRPRYIATAPRLGYRMVAVVTPWTEQA